MTTSIANTLELEHLTESCMESLHVKFPGHRWSDIGVEASLSSALAIVDVELSDSALEERKKKRVVQYRKKLVKWQTKLTMLKDAISATRTGGDITETIIIDIQHILIAVEDAYNKLKFIRISDDGFGYNYTISDFSSVIEFAKSLDRLIYICNSDPSLIDPAMQKQLIKNVIAVTHIAHSNHYCDSVCLEFLTLLATVDSGADLLQTEAMSAMNYWRTCTGIAAFENKVKAVMKKMDETFTRKEIMMERISEETDRGIRKRVNALPQLFKDLPRTEFCGIFPKSCPGCIGLNLICAAEILDDTNLVWNVVTELLRDPSGQGFTRSELDTLRRLSRSQYSRKSRPYPFMGNCLDFGMTSQIVTEATRLGNLIKSS